MSIFEYVHRECNHWFELLIQGSAEAVFPKCKARSRRSSSLRLGSALPVDGLRSEAKGLVGVADIIVGQACTR